MTDKLQTYRELLAASRAAMANSYAPYSGYKVGAALLTSTGNVFCGCNVENAVFDGRICAERTALVKAVSEGHRQFEAIAVVCEKTYDTWPCGICRQFLREFGEDLIVISQSADGGLKTKSLRELLPFSFGPGHILGCH